MALSDITPYTSETRKKKENGSVIVEAPAINATINGQKAEYLFWIVAATSVGDGPSSLPETA